MAMNREELARVIEALQPCVGRPLDSVWQPARDRVVIGLADGTFLLLVPRGPFARLHSLARRPKNPARPYSFQGACRAHLSGSLVALVHLQPEREVELRFQTGTLRLRLTGRSGGLWLLDGHDASPNVIAAYDGPAAQTLPELPTYGARDEAPQFDMGTHANWDLAARSHYMRAESAQRLADRKRQLARDLQRAIQRSRRLAVRLEADLEKASRAPAIRARADLIAAHLHSIPPGATSFAATDWETGDEVVLSLDPAWPASRTMETLYKKARRLDRVGDHVLDRMEQNEGLLHTLVHALERLPDADRAELQTIGNLLPKAGGTQRRNPTTGVTVWNGPNGERVLVGRNAKGNRRLTFQLARGTDWWFHLRERPGAHVVVPMAKGATPDLRLMLAAAQIALVHAKLPTGSSADVQYTRVKHIRPIPGETARVRVAEEKVLHVTRDPTVLLGWSSAA